MDFCLFYIHLTILDLFWTNFGLLLNYLRTKFGLQYQVHELLHEKQLSAFKWSRKMVLTDFVDLVVCFWLFWANLGPILAPFRPKMPKYDPVKPVGMNFYMKSNALLLS